LARFWKFPQFKERPEQFVWLNLYPMARIFTTPFLYRGQKYTAVVAINDAAGTIFIYLPDESLYPILPDGKLTIRIKDRLPADAKDLATAHDLITSIMKAVEAHGSIPPAPGF
jgi:hypothetical protein